MKEGIASIGRLVRRITTVAIRCGSQAQWLSARRSRLGQMLRARWEYWQALLSPAPTRLA
jgi:hypothetical protein